MSDSDNNLEKTSSVESPDTAANSPPIINQEKDIVVRAIDVVKEYGTGDNVTQALKGANLNIFRGEYMCIMGPSGSGKSTLFNMIGGLGTPTSGMVFIDEVDVAQLDSYELAWLRCRKIGYIFQSYNILPVLTAMENVSLPMLFAGMNPDDAREKTYELLKRVGIAHRAFNRPYQLSGGQQQRVAIARALANDPAIILADEPTANLDLKTGEEIKDMMKQLQEEDNVTIICATHDMKMIDICNRVVWIVDGQVTKIENREDIDVDVGTIE
ncbi:MAG: ABC transporter [Planctomycetota bacterium]|nr:MAG: ABC transporter [Planctomycetota bacterium]